MANKRRKGGKIGRPPKIIVNTDGVETPLPVNYIRKCGSCSQKIVHSDGGLAWETLEFCNKVCLEKFQNKIGSKCTNCNSTVKRFRLGKLCVRIGYKISQFCDTTCLNKYRAEAKVCAHCHKDITRDESAIFVDVGGGECKDFCLESCKTKYIKNANQEHVTDRTCVTCNRQTIALELQHGDKVVLFCGNVCYTAYKYSHNLASNQCKSCHKYFENKILEENSMYYNDETCSFCSPACKNRYINTEKKILQCSSCKIQKYSFDLIEVTDEEPPIMMCSLKCLNAHEALHSNKSSNTSTPIPISKNSQVVKPQAKKDVVVQTAKNIVNRNPTPSSTTTESTKSTTSTPVTKSDTVTPELNPPPQFEIKVPHLPGPPRNVATMCKVNVATISVGTEKLPSVSVGCQKEVETNSVEVQTEGSAVTILPLPMPIYIPVPMMMYSAPFPVPFPFPVPLPVPIFIPTSKKTHKGVTKRIQKILDRSLKDPLQDEMLLLAEMASKGTKEANSSTESESEEEKPVVNPVAKRRNRGGKRVSFGNVNRTPPRRARFSKQNVSYVDYDNDTDILPRTPKRSIKRVSFNNDIVKKEEQLQEQQQQQPKNNRRVMFAEDQQNDSMIPYGNILKQPIDDDLSNDVKNDIYHSYENNDYTAPPTPRNFNNDFNERDDYVKRKKRQSSPFRSGVPPKRSRPVNNSASPMSPVQPAYSPPMPQPAIPKPLPPLHELFKKPDNEMHLKYSIGVSAWQQWLYSKHPGRFNPDLLQLSCEDLENSLCLFVNEVQKPNGQIYTPDTIYYFCLGIQQHLFLNGRTDNIFYNPIYKRFTDCLDEIAKKFLILYNDSDFIVTRIEEEHLWESKQLGAHSPQVLLNTLLFFNTKYFNLTTVEEHKSLFFSHIMKNVKYPAQKSGRNRSVVLRYYPNGKESQPQGKPRKKKGFEQYENEENPLRCPIRLYEFYISKCPENIKGTNTSFYLLPVHSCLPESSVWYTPMSVPEHDIDKVLNRFKIVREVTMALLAK